ncbi:MAG TPA: hypothetical protein VGN57_07360 [Pirellulaceae bacterium]|nr:hypothetical protein [Pirellulaceae bacterium]
MPLLWFATAFSCSAARRAILQGYLAHRAAIHAAGLMEGFQWIDGSFVEDIETTESRDPADIDVVTFYHADAATAAAAFVHSPWLFPTDEASADFIESQFSVDGYFEQLRVGASHLVRRCTYWHSLLSHRRDRVWKGHFQIDLDPRDDAAAAAVLNAASTATGTTP